MIIVSDILFRVARPVFGAADFVFVGAQNSLLYLLGQFGVDRKNGFAPGAVWHFAAGHTDKTTARRSKNLKIFDNQSVVERDFGKSQQFAAWGFNQLNANVGNLHRSEF